VTDNRPHVDVLADWRLKAITIFVSACFAVLGLRLFQLQILRGSEMARLAEMNRTQIIPLRAPRAVVMDRHGDVLLENAPNFSLFYSAQALPEKAHRNVEDDVLRWFPAMEPLLKRKFAEARLTGKMTRISADIPRPVALALIEKRLSLPGVSVVVEPKRRARYGSLCSHVLGYVDEISSAELERLREEGYRMGQLVGRMGIERVYENILRGEDGGIQFEMDAGGRHVHVMRRIAPRPGPLATLTIDRRLQEAVEQGLKASETKKGAAVVVDPRSGAVLALASSPDFDPSASVIPYLTDPGLPLFNRAIQGTYPPGSVFKIVDAAAALFDADWDIKQTFNCPGKFYVGSKEFGCWGVHHVKDFMGAVAWSCNVYFYNLGIRTGPDAIERMARAFGFAEKTGIDLTSETAGFIPGRAWKKEYRKVPWFDGDTANLAIGQGAVAATPLQVAMMVSSVANGGQLWKPFVMDSVVDRSGRVLFKQSPVLRRTVEMPQRIWERLGLAMQGVVTVGTGRGVHRPDLVVGAKSGTAQNPHGREHAWFAAYAGRPGEPASLVVVVCVENGGRGSAAAGPVARAAINAAFPLEKKT